MDSRLLRSFGALLFRPGLLTLAYMEGRRNRYLSPIGLFLLANLVFFFAPSISDFNINLLDQVTLQSYSPWIAPWVEQYQQQQQLSFDQLSMSYQLRVNELAKLMVIWHVPWLALITAILAVHRKLYFADHLVAALHFMAFLMLYTALMPLTILPLLREIQDLTGGGWAWRTALTIKLFYVPFMLRKGFGLSWWWLLPATALYLLGLNLIHISYRFVQFVLTFNTLPS